jgi:quinol monooxygenase YgiN
MSALLAERRAATRASRVVELRQYTLHPGRRDALIDLFEREFVDTQEACGMQLLGTFRDLDDPDRFTWLRGFPDMPSRAAALAAFYGGPAWRAHRDAANATMVDSDDVHLLRPLGALPSLGRETRPGDESVVTLTLYPLRRGGAAEFADFFERALVPLLWNASVAVAARFTAEPAENTFPALPVRAADTVFAWLGQHASEARAGQALARIEEALDWSPALAAQLAARLVQAPQVLRLAPTARSRLRG